MSEVSRRGFIKTCGLGVGAVMVSNLWFDKVFAGGKPVSESLFQNEKFGLSKEEIKKILEIALSKGGEFSEVFFEYSISSSVVMEEDIIKNSSESISLGVGIRVVNGEQTGYAYSNDLAMDKIKNAALTAGAIATGSAKVKVANLTVRNPKIQVYDLAKNFHDEKIDTKIAMIKETYEAAKKFDSKIAKVTASIVDEVQFVTIANSEGLYTSDVRPLVGIRCSATAQEGSIRNTGQSHNGGRVGMDFYKNVETPAQIGARAANEAIILLSAKDAPSGELPVVLSKDQSGVMIHEAVGHPLEADANWKKMSIMWDKLGQMVANPEVTIYDDATIPNFRGSLNIDDEGVETQNVMLIEKGKLVGYLNDRLSAKIMNVAPNGHGRRESFRSPAIPRMNNTVLGKGKYDPQEIISSVEKGIYAVTYQGGQVSNTGKFTFSVNMGYLIENGKLTTPIKNTTLIGTNTQILKDMAMIGNDTGFFLGTCGKEGQSVPVTCGTPTLKITKMTVGGAA